MLLYFYRVFIFLRSSPRPNFQLVYRAQVAHKKAQILAQGAQARFHNARPYVASHHPRPNGGNPLAPAAYFPSPARPLL